MKTNEYHYSIQINMQIKTKFQQVILWVPNQTETIQKEEKITNFYFVNAGTNLILFFQCVRFKKQVYPLPKQM